MFGADLYADTRLLPLFRRILGIEGFKPLDCVGEPEEMILAMHHAYLVGSMQGSQRCSFLKHTSPKATILL